MALKKPVALHRKRHIDSLTYAEDRAIPYLQTTPNQALEFLVCEDRFDAS